MCVPTQLTEAEVSRRGLLGLGAVGLAAGATLLTEAEANAVPRNLMAHRHSSGIVPLGVAGGPPPEIGRAGIASALVIGDRVCVVDFNDFFTLAASGRTTHSTGSCLRPPGNPRSRSTVPAPPEASRRQTIPACRRSRPTVQLRASPIWPGSRCLLGGLAEAAGAERLVLNHLVPADPKLMSDSTWRRNARRGYSGRVYVRDDLMSLPLKRRRATVIG